MNNHHAEFMRLRYHTGKQHDRKMSHLAWTLIGYAVALSAVIFYLISK